MCAWCGLAQHNKLPIHSHKASHWWLSSFVCLRRDGGFSERRTDCTAATFSPFPDNRLSTGLLLHFPDGEKFSRRPDFRITFFPAFLRQQFCRHFLAPKTLTESTSSAKSEVSLSAALPGKNTHLRDHGHLGWRILFLPPSPTMQ